MHGLLIGARFAVETCMGVKSGERILIVTDPPRRKIAEALLEAARIVGARTMLICMPTGTKHGEEPPKLVADAMRTFDVVLAPTTYSLTHTQARLQACKAGARVATMPMITEDMMSRGAMLANYNQVRELTLKVAKVLDKASEVEILTRAGTRLTFSIRGRRAHSDTGIFHKPGDFGNLPAGEAFIAPLEGTGHGRVIVDGSMVDTLHGRIELRMKKGKATEILGKHSEKLAKMLEEVGKKAYNLAEFGIGTNPKARLIGNVLEDEKVMRTCHIALGDNSTFGGKVRAGIHVDGILLKPTIKLDGKVVMQNGRLKI
ncbi:MAG: aminopeptidase [Candidatus Hadarchaeaceae archaeon]